MYTVQGIKVNMPFQPYPSQLAMMNKVLEALKMRKNCLIESPTGSGKSLALLCAALAWQQSYEGRLPSTQRLLSTVNFAEKSFSKETETLPTSDCLAFEDPYDKFDLEDFTSPPPKKVDFDLTTNAGENELLESVPIEQTEYYSVPKIFFCSRTHRQLSQLVRELRKSCYTDISMTILASRDHTCLHPYVSRQADKSAECKKLISGLEVIDEQEIEKERDRFLGNVYANLQKESSLRNDSSTESFVWDIEDLFNVGQDCQLCPYFLCTDFLYRYAKVIFCPYNYLLDPLVRKSMKISLKNSVVIIDEAHNIEDVCRESVSFSLSKDELSTAVEQLRLLGEQCSAELCDAAEVCISHFDQLIEWIKKEAIVEHMTTQEPGDYTRIWHNADVYVMLKAMGLDQSAVGSLKKALTVFTEGTSDCGEDNDRRGNFGQVEPRILVTVEKLAYALHYVYMDKGNVLSGSSNDTYSYCLCLEKCSTSLRDSLRTSSAEWLSKSMFKSTDFVDYLHFWCMNPALAFNDVSKSARSVVLASGTLSPMDTYASELGVPFPIRLEAMHVLPPERVYVGAVGLGPSGKVLKATYQDVDSFEFQDELALTLSAICKVIPDGVLCFLPSYRLLEKLVKRWQDTVSLWKKMSEQKLVLVEPRKGNELEGVLCKFHEAIAKSSALNSQSTGALLLAVYRGKVAEGIDFADRLARAVVTVGIPYPNVKDVRISLKRQYNDCRLSGCRDKVGKCFISGSQWLKTQAFRSLNQALGRCLRHRQDWGALIMLDARFCHYNFHNGLSKWIRSKFQHYSCFDEMMDDLSSFVNRLEGK
ncbi:Fanconi anemia group J protein [Trichuris trichiura]|uniref:DNA 5'-3' helicase n=1 Tax=Trichuris trichiura TaxID=36087 RepID=A0A077Z370_TRITR|nr:Fanconi anemia group J protein [Trichuris trichiura]